jgi:hypothetical protein
LVKTLAASLGTPVTMLRTVVTTLEVTTVSATSVVVVAVVVAAAAPEALAVLPSSQ